MTTDRFERLKTLFTAIQNLDNTTAVKNDNKDVLDAVLDVIKDIPKSEFPVDCQEKIISNIRESLVVLYNNELKQLGSRIGLDYKDPDIVGKSSKEETELESLLNTTLNVEK